MPVFCAAQQNKTLIIHFDFDRYNLRTDAKASLDSFVRSIKTDGIAIQLNGHCDFIGNDNYNDKLSLQRVKTVKEYLTAAGVDAALFTIEEGHGKRLPLNSNASEHERMLNRRVEVTLLMPAKEEVVKLAPAEKSIEKMLEDTSVKNGSTLILNNINFYGGLHRFLPESTAPLNELLAAMKKNAALVIQIQGHICCQPGNEDGLDNETRLNNLSEARAKAVYDFLINNGIDAKRMSYMGFGHSVPMYPYPEQSNEQRTLNRRVEIKIISK